MNIEDLLDIEAIKQLKAEYCDICDDDHNPDRIVTIFTADGIWEGEGAGYAKGHADIRRLFEGFQRSISFSQHNVFNPRITIDGNAAHGTWYLMGPFTMTQGNRQRWLAARYEDDYEKGDDGVWRIKHLRAVARMNAAYEKGWARPSS